MTGPIVRITPNTLRAFSAARSPTDLLTQLPFQLHFRNPRAFHDIFSPQNKTVKNQVFYHHLALPDSSFALEGEEHRARWKLMAPLFARSHLHEIQGVIQRNVRPCVLLPNADTDTSQVQRLCDLLQRIVQVNRSIELALGYRGLALDIIDDFIFPVIPNNFRGLENEIFRNPLTISTYYSFDWTMWLMRNFSLSIQFHEIAKYLSPFVSQGWLLPAKCHDEGEIHTNSSNYLLALTVA